MSILIHMSIDSSIGRILGLLALCALCVSATPADIEKEPGLVSLEDSNIICGLEIQPKQVLVIDIEGQKLTGSALENHLALEAGAYRLVTNELVLIPKVYGDGKKRRQYMIRDARNSVAALGCDLLVIVGIEFADKQWEDPRSARSGTLRWVTVGYALTLIGIRDL